MQVRSIPAEVIYASRDPFAHKIFIDRGAVPGVPAGSAVADDTGIVGQVTRVHPLVSEVTLITDQDQAIPVQVVRSGLRAVAFGSGPSGTLELRFMAANAEVQTGDLLVTSGIDGTYPAGLPVASVMRIERDAEHSFARVVCQPSAGVDRGRYVLVLTNEAKAPPRPDDAAPGKDRRLERRRSRRSEPPKIPGNVTHREADGPR
jgi:rod shape-determining protein MreC